jgi:hypothetical protein
MATPAGPLDGHALLAAVSDAMSELHERYYQRPPTTTKAQMMGADLLACVLGGVYTDDTVQRLSGRRVEHFISSHNIGPDLEIELFFFAAS